MAYVAYTDYTNYLNGRAPAIPEGEFPFWADKASVYVDSQTYGNVAKLKIPYPAYFLNCVCTVAEKIYEFDNTPSANTIVSEKTGNYSVTYEKITEERVQKKLHDTLIMYLADTGLLYRGTWE
ncbi:MAG: hypothetical protein LBL34_04785 [Clostridiales bacterium]|jgi:hypothetical protein|nr:hypothetical protein [Clostridiales bacterium]